MAITHVTALRNILADAVDNYINTTGTGEAQGDFVILDSAVVLARIDLQAPAFGAASSGVITLAGTPLTATAAASGTADLFELQDRDDGSVVLGTATLTSGGGDIELDNTNITTSQVVEVTSFTYTAPA